MNKLNVQKSDKVVAFWGRGDNEHIVGVRTVVGVSKNGTIRVQANENTPVLQYDAEGYPKGKANNYIRELREGENADEIQAGLNAKLAAEIAAQRAAAEIRRQAAEEERARRENKAQEWMDQPGNVRISSLYTQIAGQVWVVEIFAARRPTVLMVAAEKQKRYEWDDCDTYRVTIGIHTGGSTGSTVKGEPNINDIVRGYIKSWLEYDLEPIAE